MNSNRKLHNKTCKRALDWGKVFKVIKETTQSLLLLMLLGIFLYIVVQEIDYRKNVKEILNDSNYTVIKEFNDEIKLQYNNETKEVSLVYVDRRGRELSYIRKELAYIYNEDTKDIEYKTSE